MCSCCCPPAISALFYLWVRSGFSKGSVAGALTFFPPDPPLYKFQRVGKNGEILPDVDDDDANDRVENNDGEEEKDNGDYCDDEDSDLGTFEIDTKSSHQTNNKTNNNANNKSTDERLKQQQRQQRQEQQQQRQQEAASQDPIVAMTERSNKLRRRAKHRAQIDSSDAKNGVTYKFIPDTVMLGNCRWDRSEG